MNNLQVSWVCPSNIALVKYWGKRPQQLPMNPSLSFSLKKSRTRTSVQLLPTSQQRLTFLFEGEPSVFAARIERYLDTLSIEIPWINDYSFRIESENTFPHSAGIASSASAFGALALCLAELDQQLTGTEKEPVQFMQTASRLARLGSGSASRSVWPGFAWWGKSAALSGSTDCYALPVSKNIHDCYFRLCDAVLLVDSTTKKVSSSAGHGLMNNHPFRDARVQQANNNIESLLRVMQTDDRLRFLEIVENEALSLHALMMSSMPSYVLLKPESLQIIEKIRTFREETGLPVGFTIDAGPNIHLLYWEEHRDEVHAFIQKELTDLLEGGKWLDDRIGTGPVKA